MGYADRCNVNKLEGKTLVDVVVGEDEIIFTCSDGERYKMFHQQDCCEHVWIEDIEGDINDLIGGVVIRAEEREGESIIDEKYGDSTTWTFYQIDTNKGGVWIRWCGQSNGYYSESVDFEKMED